MRTRALGRMAVAAVAVVVAVAVAALSGCASPTAVESPAPSPTASPLFTTDAEALAAAERAYAEFQAMEDQIGAEGGANPDRIRDFAVRDALEGALEGYETYVADKLRTVGSIQFSNAELLRWAPYQELNAIVAIACLDVSDVDLLDSTGLSRIPETRVARQTFAVSFDVVDGRDLLVSSRERYSEEDKCA